MITPQPWPAVYWNLKVPIIIACVSLFTVCVWSPLITRWYGRCAIENGKIDTERICGKSGTGKFLLASPVRVCVSIESIERFCLRVLTNFACKAGMFLSAYLIWCQFLGRHKIGPWHRLYNVLNERFLSIDQILWHFFSAIRTLPTSREPGLHNSLLSSFCA